MEAKIVIKMIPSEFAMMENRPTKCTVPECSSSFENISNLHMHLEKHHRIHVKKLIDDNTVVRYFCPVAKCKYNVTQSSSSCFFKSRKYLKQHFLKVHAPKIEKCTKCDKAFANATLKRQHEPHCGTVFHCIDCDCKYTTRECLLTHCKRKGHKVPQLVKNPTEIKYLGDTIKEDAPQKISCARTANQSIRIASTIKTLDNQQTIRAMKRVQDILRGSPAAKIRANFERIMLKGKKKEPTVSQMTQTASLYNDNCAKMVTSQTTVKTKSISNEITATKIERLNATGKYKDLDLIDEESNTLIGDPRHLNKNLNNLSFAVDDSSLHYFTVSNFNAGLCHIETQTDLMPFEGSNMETASEMDPLLCHMHTQTSNEILTELGLTDIQTQTNWPTEEYNDLFVSAETQTYFPQLTIGNISAQTQTIAESSISTVKIRESLNWSDHRHSSQCTQTQLE